MSLFSELKRRNVFRVAAMYCVASWVLLQVGGLLFDALGVPSWGIRLLIGLLLLGFVPALVFAWAYEMTPDGLRREADVDPSRSITTQTARKLDLAVIAMLVVAVALLGTDRWLGKRDATAGPARTLAGSTPAAAAPSTPESSASIAVLPFVNMSDDKANEYFSDGLTEELLNALANVQGLRVIARTSSFSYKGKEIKIADVARELDVDNVLEGSVRKAGNKVRITTQLIRASDSSHVWSQTYDRDLADVFALQDEISGEVVNALKVRLLQARVTRAEAGSTQAAAAYDAYLQGIYYGNQGYGEESIRKALDAYTEAIRLDPKFARAYAGRSQMLIRLASNGYVPYDEGFRQAKDAAQRSVELAPELAESYSVTSNLKLVADLDANGALADAERAARLNPGSVDVQANLGTCLGALGRLDDAIAAAKSGVDLDPLSPRAQVGLASALYFARRYQEAEVVARRAKAMPASAWSQAHASLGMALLQQQRYDEALREFDQEQVQWARMTGRALVFARTQRAAEARAEMKAMHDKMGDAPAYQLAEISAQLGDLEGTFRWLETARRIRDPGLITNMATDPMLDPVRRDARFSRLLSELGLARAA